MPSKEVDNGACNLFQLTPADSFRGDRAQVPKKLGLRRFRLTRLGALQYPVPMKQEHPRPEIIGNYRVVYPIFREDLAEAILTPLPAAPEKAPAKLSAPPAEQKGQQ